MTKTEDVDGGAFAPELQVLPQQLDTGHAAVTLVRDMDDGVTLAVQPEDDNEHYRDHEPGPMPGAR